MTATILQGRSTATAAWRGSTATATTASASTASERRVTREGVAITSDKGVTLSLYLILLKYLFTIVQKYTVKLSTQMFK